MGAPATQGRLCTKLEEMQIGDYIRCTYTADTANVAGVFLNLGASTVETELPLIPGAMAEGYFYFIKVGKGLLVADRMVQSEISAYELNKKNYLIGTSFNNHLIRILTEKEFIKYLTNSNLNGCIIKQDINVWHKAVLKDAYYDRVAVNYIAYEEYVSDIINGTVKLKINADNTTPILYFKPNQGSANAKRIPPEIFNFNISIYDSGEWSYNGYYGTKAKVRGYGSFRPALEYIDNLKSKTIWY